MREFTFNKAASDEIRFLILDVHNDCPGQIQSRYLARIETSRDKLPGDLHKAFWVDPSPLLVNNLPTFPNIEHSKILTLFLGETIGRCAAYSEYNQSYITDIRPTSLSKELSSGSELLGMHNDLTFASDKCRPAALVLVPHIAEGNVPKTLLATAPEIDKLLTAEERDLLQRAIFEIRSGGSLCWPCEQVRRLSIFDRDTEGRMRVRLSFTNIRPLPSLPEIEQKKAQKSLARVAEIALQIGRTHGRCIREGQGLIIPNDYCLHGRDTFEDETCKRLLLRSYVITQDAVDHQHGNTMLSLRL